MADGSEVPPHSGHANEESSMPRGDLPRPDDLVECHLYTKYKHDLWSRMAKKKVYCYIPASHNQSSMRMISLVTCHTCKGGAASVPLKVGADGSLALYPRQCAIDLADEKDDTKQLALAGKKREPLTAEKLDGDASATSDLDPYAQAALKALPQRNICYVKIVQKAH